MILDNITVLCLAEQFPGPFATMLLADLGADVILVERFPGGDPSRQHGAYYQSLGRNKRSILLDLKSTAGHSAFLELVRTADVVLEGYRPGTVDRLGVGYEALRSVNPAIIYASISAFGQDGPYAAWPAHDISSQGVAGALDYVYATGRHEDNPSLVAGDISSAMFTTIAVLAALYERQKSGRGDYIDVAMGDCVAALSTPGIIPTANGAPQAEVPGNLSVRSDEPGYGIFRTSDDRFITISLAYEDKFWDALCATLDLPGLMGIPSQQRRDRTDELRRALQDVIGTETSQRLLHRFEEAGIPAGPVLQWSEVPQDPHMKHRGVFTTDESGAVAIAFPVIFRSIGRGGPLRRAPSLGEHTAEVLTEAGVSDQVIAEVLDRASSSTV